MPVGEDGPEPCGARRVRSGARIAGDSWPLRIAVVHNLLRGGARRRLTEQIAHLDGEVTEVCLGTAASITDRPRIVPFAPAAPLVRRALRVPLRYVDLALLVRAWWEVGAVVRSLDADVVYANPCQFLQAPVALLGEVPPSLYFCDEPRRVDSEKAAKATRNPLTQPVYAPMYAAERQLDRRAVARATQLAANSAYSAGQIRRAYDRDATVVPMGVPDLFREVEPRPPTHVLSVGTLIPSKGHDVAIRSAAQTSRRWPVVVVAPRPNPEEERRLTAIAGEVGISLEVRVGISDRELAEAYAAAQATLYLAAREPFGLVSIEAQAAGSPVIVAGEGGLPETVVDGQGGWIVLRSPSAASAKLQQLESPDLRARMSAAARAHAAGATWTQSARAVQGLLEALRT